MQSALKKLNKYRLMEPPEERPENKIIAIHGKIIQNEGIKNDTKKNLEKSDLFYEGILRMNYELIAENERLRRKCNKLIKSYNILSKKNRKNEKLIEKYRTWKKKRNKNFKKWYKKRKKAKLKSMKIKIKGVKKNDKRKANIGKRSISNNTNKKQRI